MIIALRRTITVSPGPLRTQSWRRWSPRPKGIYATVYLYLGYTCLSFIIFVYIMDMLAYNSFSLLESLIYLGYIIYAQ